MSEEYEAAPTMVTVSADDLGTLLFATGAIKNVEAALKQRSEDPQVPTQTPIREAHDRLAAQWRGAIREMPPGFDEPLTAVAGGIVNEIGCHPHGVEWTNLPALRELRQKGMVQLGSVHEAIFWGESELPELRGVGVVRVRLTARGQAEWMKLNPEGKVDTSGSFGDVKGRLFKKLTEGG